MFGERLKILRTDKDMRQKDLAELLKVSPSTIGMYERGHRDPDTETVKFLSQYFNVSTDYLLGLVDNPNSIGVIDNRFLKDYHSIGVEYLKLAKEMQDKDISPEDVRKILEVLKKHT